MRIYDRTAFFGMFYDTEHSYVIYTDIPMDNSDKQSSNGSKGGWIPQQYATIHFSNETVLDFVATRKSVKLNGDAYSYTSGQVFTVRSNGDQLKITQLPIELHSMALANERFDFLTELASSGPVAKFYESVGAK